MQAKRTRKPVRNEKKISVNENVKTKIETNDNRKRRNEQQRQ